MDSDTIVKAENHPFDGMLLVLSRRKGDVLCENSIVIHENDILAMSKEKIERVANYLFELFEKEHGSKYR
jgi:hypothetical protein